MRRIVLFFIFCIIIAFSILVGWIWYNKEYYGVTLNNYPFLHNILTSYAMDNFEYPQSTKDVLSYWDTYKQPANNILDPYEIKLLQHITFNRLKRNVKSIRFIDNDTLFIMVNKKDTIIVHNKTNINPCDILSSYSNVDQRNMKTFFRVSMQREDSHNVNIATAEMADKFNNGLYNLVCEKHPEFRQNREQRKEFKVLILEYNKGILSTKCPSLRFDFEQNPLYGELTNYIADFASKNQISKIIFYYMYD